MLRRLGGAALVAATAWTAADAAADSAMYARAKSMVLAAAADSPQFAEAVGAPYEAGPWYNSSVAITNGGHVATVTLPVRGSRRSSDVTVRVVRKGGLRSTLLHNTVGAADWDVLVMQALVGMGAGGRPISLSLLPQVAPPADPAAAAAAAEALGHGHGLAAAAAKQAAAAEQEAAGRAAAEQAAAAAQQAGR